MPPRRFSQHLHPDEYMPQTSTQNQPPTQILSTIIEGSDNATFGNILKVDVLPPPNNISTTAAGSSQNTGGTSSTQINRGTPHQSPPQALSPIQVIQGNTKLEQIQVEDWEDEAAAKAELAKVQQEIERLHQEQETINHR
jgi:hypothetical protein